MPREENSGGEPISPFFEFLQYTLKDMSIGKGEHPRHVFKHQCLRLKFINEPEIVLEKSISRIVKESVGCID